MFTCSKNLLQLLCSPVHDAVLAIEGAQSLIKWDCARVICFRSGVGYFQSVLIALAADLPSNKPWQGQHKFWKYVSPICIYFA